MFTMSGGLYDRHLKKERLKRSIFLPNCCISRHNKAARNKDSTSLCSIVTLQKKGGKRISTSWRRRRRRGKGAWGTFVWRTPRPPEWHGRSANWLTEISRHISKIASPNTMLADFPNSFTAMRDMHCQVWKFLDPPLPACAALSHDALGWTTSSRLRRVTAGRRINCSVVNSRTGEEPKASTSELTTKEFFLPKKHEYQHK